MEDDIQNTPTAPVTVPTQDLTPQNDPAPQVVAPQDPAAPQEPQVPQAPQQDRTTDLIAKARQEEKNKLYPQIQKLEGENKTLEARVSELETENTALKAELEEAKKTMGDQNISIDQIRAEFAAELDKRDAENKRLAREAELKLYRERKIHEANGEIIPELVALGEDEATIDQSVETAKARFKQIADNAASKAAPAAPSAPLMTPQAPRESAPLDLSKSRDLSNEEWAKVRREMMAQAAGTAGLPQG